jgi:hypothetical protein
MEHMNQNIERYLHAFITYHQDDWKEWLSTAEFLYNDSVHTATQQTPFFSTMASTPGKEKMQDKKLEMNWWLKLQII